MQMDMQHDDSDEMYSARNYDVDYRGPVGVPNPDQIGWPPKQFMVLKSSQFNIFSFSPHFKNL